ncbi:MAG: methyltransferase domain-containing protein [Rhodospirillales bacterium]|nr:methyltransferase domain-containing protein [Rhodospirillales bacterium]
MPSHAPAQPSPDPTAPNARAVALDLIEATLRRRRPLDDAFEGHPTIARLAARDRAFTRLLAATTLRRLGQIDAALAACLDKDLTPKARDIRDILRLGAAQLLFLDTPPHAAVGETVELAAGRRAPYRPLVNAVLRRLARDGAGLLASQDAPRLNTPDWLWNAWAASYGAATARAIAAAHLVEPPLDITVRTDLAAWAGRLDARRLPTGSLRRAMGGAIGELPGYAEGAWWVQDAAAALPTRLLGQVDGKTVLDLCAAPGGKTAQLAAMGARVVALDRSAPRLARLRANLARLGLAVETVVADATAWQPPAPAPFILLDAPCSGTGTIRRHPEIQRLKSPADLDRLVPAQDRLLDAAVAMLAPGGILVYCTCSLEPEEGPARIAALLARQPALTRRPLSADEVDGLVELVTADGDLRTLPCHLAEAGGLDGFYAARLVKET